MKKSDQIKESIEKINFQLENNKNIRPDIKEKMKISLKNANTELEKALEEEAAEEAKKQAEAKKPTPKKPAPKKAEPKKAEPKKSDRETVTINGKTFDVLDCQEAIEAWEARKKQSEKSNKAYKTKPVTQKVADNVQTAVKQAVDSVSEKRIENSPNEVIKGTELIEKGIKQLFEGFEKLTGKKVSEKQRKDILAILLEIKEEAKENR